MSLFARLKALFHRQSKKIIIHGPNGKYVGFVQNGVYETTRDAKRHWFFKYGGYSISTSVLESLQNANVKEIDILEHRDDGDRRLVSQLNDWFTNSESYIYKGDSQRVLPLKFFQIGTV